MSDQLWPKPGDIVLYPVDGRSSLASKLVAIGELLWGKGRGPEQYSHVAILEDRDHTLEARWPKTGRYRLNKNRLYEIWRVDGISDAERQLVLHWAYLHSNEWYNLGALFFGLFQSKHSEVCSTFVAHALEHAGVVHRKFSKFTTPNQIRDITPMTLVTSNWGKHPKFGIKYGLLGGFK